AILPIGDDGRIVLVRQYRSPAQRYIYEIPAGTRETGEEPITTATRELIEETGYHAERSWLMTHFFSSPGIFQEELYLFKATGLTPGNSHLEDGEDLEVRLFTKDELRHMIRDGEIEDGKTLLALLSLFSTDDFFNERQN
ncbi:MAG: NUDIX hydrolase, partial [Thermoguttaceae bacterium]|nr:NUDIX hydrolase [Thermoguttaceae bacterium]